MSERFHVPWHWWLSPPPPFIPLPGLYYYELGVVESTELITWNVGTNQLLLLKDLIIFTSETAVDQTDVYAKITQNDHILVDLGSDWNSICVNLVHEIRLPVEGPAVVKLVVNNENLSVGFRIFARATSWLVNDLHRHREESWR